MKYCIVLVFVAWQFALTSTFLNKQNWRFYVLDAKVRSSTPHIAHSEFNVTRIRGIGSVLSGYLDIKEELTDETMMEIKILKNIPGKNEFRGTPYGIPKSRLSDFMNLIYKPVIMNDIKECAPEAPQFTKFKAPLKKTLIQLNKCPIGENTSNLPGYMSEAVYKVLVICTGQISTVGEFIVKVEHE